MATEGRHAILNLGGTYIFLIDIVNRHSWRRQHARGAIQANPNLGATNPYKFVFD